MKQLTLFKVRDKRRKDKFDIDDVYLNGYAKILGPMVSAVYMSLCRHADLDTQEAFPSEEKIADEWDITDRTVRTAIKKLKEASIIVVEQEKTMKGKWLNNVYILLDKSEWLKPEEMGFLRSAGGKKRTKPEEASFRLRINLKEGLPIKRSSSRFTPPSLEEVKNYCKERKNEINAQNFIDFYSAKGWMIGKNKMKDWRAAVRTWEARNGYKPPEKKIIVPEKPVTPEEKANRERILKSMRGKYSFPKCQP